MPAHLGATPGRHVDIIPRSRPALEDHPQAPARGAWAGLCMRSPNVAGVEPWLSELSELSELSDHCQTTVGPLSE